MCWARARQRRRDVLPVRGRVTRRADCRPVDSRSRRRPCLREVWPPTCWTPRPGRCGCRIKLHASTLPKSQPGPSAGDSIHLRGFGHSPRAPRPDRSWQRTCRTRVGHGPRPGALPTPPVGWMASPCRVIRRVGHAGGARNPGMPTLAEAPTGRIGTAGGECEHGTRRRATGQRAPPKSND